MCLFALHHVVFCSIALWQPGRCQGRSQKSGDGGANIFDRKPHLLINAETESNYYSVRVPVFTLIQTVTSFK